VAEKSKPLPNYQKKSFYIVLNTVSKIRFTVFVKLKYESSTIILSVGIIYSLRDLLSDLNNYV